MFKSNFQNLETAIAGGDLIVPDVGIFFLDSPKIWVFKKTHPKHLCTRPDFYEFCDWLYMVLSSRIEFEDHEILPSSVAPFVTAPISSNINGSVGILVVEPPI